jgi:uncharacterized protein YcfL
MYSKRRITVAALSLIVLSTLSVAAPASGLISSKVELTTSDDSVQVTDLRAVQSNRLLRVQAELTNFSPSDQQVYYRFKWLDKNGFMVAALGFCFVTPFFQEISRRLGWQSPTAPTIAVGCDQVSHRRRPAGGNRSRVPGCCRASPAQPKLLFPRARPYTHAPEVARRTPSRLGRRWPFLSRDCPGAASFIFSHGLTMAARQTKEVWKCPKMMLSGVVVRHCW